MSIAMRLTGLAVATAFALGGAGCARADPKADAQKAAVEWLALVDQGKYAESWEQAARVRGLREWSTKEAWAAKERSERAPLGRVKSRKLKEALSMENPPGLPEGQYMLIEYSTLFENNPVELKAATASSIERVSLMLAKDRTWRVRDYIVVSD